MDTQPVHRLLALCIRHGEQIAVGIADKDGVIQEIGKRKKV